MALWFTIIIIHFILIVHLAQLSIFILEIWFDCTVGDKQICLGNIYYFSVCFSRGCDQYSVLTVCYLCFFFIYHFYPSIYLFIYIILCFFKFVFLYLFITLLVILFVIIVFLILVHFSCRNVFKMAFNWLYCWNHTAQSSWIRTFQINNHKKRHLIFNSHIYNIIQLHYNIQVDVFLTCDSHFSCTSKIKVRRAFGIQRINLRFLSMRLHPATLLKTDEKQHHITI